MAAYFPVALDLRGRVCLVVGAGSVATRKINALLEAQASLTVVAMQVSDHVRALAEEGQLELHMRPFRTDDLHHAFLVIAATNDVAVNREVAQQARAQGILVNAADDPDHCDFILPAIMRRGDIQVAITTSGRSPALARHLRQRLDALLAPEYEPLLAMLAEVRARLRQDGVRVTASDWQRAIDDELLALIRDGKIEMAAERVNDQLRRG